MDFITGLTLGLYVGSIGAAVLVAGGWAWLRHLERHAQQRAVARHEELARHAAITAFVAQLQQIPRRKNGETPIADHVQRLGIEQAIWTGRLWITVPREPVGA